MSFHQHEPEEYNRKFGVKERQRLESLQKDVDKSQSERDKEIERDLKMLDLLKEFDLTEKDVRFIHHLVGLPEGRGIAMLVKYIQGRTGSCILHYENKFVQKMPLGNFNER